MDDFILRAILAAVGIAIIAGFLGCFVVWRRMSYFSESISHSALLGASLGIVSGLGAHFGLLVVGFLFAVLIIALQERKILSNDVILGVFSHIALALGIIVLTLVSDNNVDYFLFLFGDILTVDNIDIIWIFMILLIVATLLILFWQPLLLLTLSPELAQAEGVKYRYYQLLFMLMIALVVAVAVQIIGVLLITSLLIIPPAIARVFARSPINMVIKSILFAIVASLIGIYISVYYDLATGPAIVVTLGFLFTISQIIARRKILS